MKDYLKADTLPVGTNQWIEKWCRENNVHKDWMSLFVLQAERESLSRFIIFFSETKVERDSVVHQFQDWMTEATRSRFFQTRLVAQTRAELPESNENSIIVCRRSRLVLSRDVLNHFKQNAVEVLERNLLRSLWQIICTRSSRLPISPEPLNRNWEYFGKQQLVPSIYLPPDSVPGLDDLRNVIAGVVKVVAHHRDKNFDDYAVFAGTNNMFERRTELGTVRQRQKLPVTVNWEELIDDIVDILNTYWMRH